ncbi:hypothetical protein [Winogradskya consettensis]|uniref:hypothetical protein n=1 Tax=Winogradskya consettensis TaxID=113560 RepID=UPI001BB322C6|nr:hypothetical protein [Actinoplanes consettensis]
MVAVFIAYALRAERPLLDPRVFRVATVRAGTLGVGAAFLALFGLFVNAQYLQDVKGYSTLLTGFAIAPLAVGMGVMGACAPALTGGILAGLPATGAGLGSGLNSAARELGAALGVAVIGTVLNSHHALRSAADFTAGLAIGYRILAGILAAATIVVAATWRTPAPVALEKVSR